MATQVKTGLIANNAITDSKIANVALTGVTASGGDSSTALATTAFVATEINSLIDSAPGALNTLNELAAAMGDDAAFSTTVTNSIATKLPLAGGTLTGNLKVDASFTVNGNVDTSASLGEVLQLSQTDSVGGFLWSVNRADNSYKTMSYHAGTHKFYRDATNLNMTLDSSGNVGIGVDPSTLLHIKKTGSTSAVNEFLRIENSAAGGAAAGSSINFHHYHAGGGPAGGAKAASITAQNMASWPGGTPSSYSTGLTFGTLHENSFDERMRIDSSGNVVIGNSSYGSSLGQLRVINDAASAPASLSLFGYNNISDNAEFAKIDFASQISGTGGNPTAKISAKIEGTNERAAHLTFHTHNDGGSLQERMVIDSSGKVGIGETNPDFMLHVKNANTQIAIESTTTNQNSSLYYIANGANQWETGVNITAGLDYEIYDRVNNGARMVVQHDGKIRIGNNVPMWSGSYGGGLFLKGNNSTSDRYARLAIVDSNGSETASGSLTLNNNGSVEITRSINGSGSTSYENILQISRTGGATSNAQREAAISFFDSANSTYTAMITGVRTSPAGNYDGGLSIYTNSHSQNGNATSISEMVSGHVVHFSSAQATTFYGDVYVSGANHRISQNGVTREAKGGYVAGNATVSYTVNHTNQSSFKVQAAMNHYGIMTSYGCAHEGIYGNGSGGLYSVLTQSHTSGASGSWSVTRVDTDNITVTKAAGTYSGGGYYYIIVEGANL